MRNNEGVEISYPHLTTLGGQLKHHSVPLRCGPVCTVSSAISGSSSVKGNF